MAVEEELGDVCTNIKAVLTSSSSLFIPTHFLMLGMGLQSLMYAKQTLNHRAIPLA